MAAKQPDQHHQRWCCAPQALPAAQLLPASQPPAALAVAASHCTLCNLCALLHSAHPCTLGCDIRRRQPGCRQPPPAPLAASAALLFPWRLRACHIANLSCKHGSWTPHCSSIARQDGILAFMHSKQPSSPPNRKRTFDPALGGRALTADISTGCLLHHGCSSIDSKKGS